MNKAEKKTDVDKFELKTNLPREYFVHFRDSFFIIDSNAKVHVHSFGEEVLLSDRLKKVPTNLTQIFPNIKEVLGATKITAKAKTKDPTTKIAADVPRLFLENINLNLWGEAFPFHHLAQKSEKFFIVILYNTDASKFLLGLLSDKPQEFIRQFLKDNMKQILLFTGEMHRYVEFLGNFFHKKLNLATSEGQVMQQGLDYITNQVNYFRSFYIQQDRQVQTRSFEVASLEDHRYLPLAFIFAELRKYALHLPVQVSNEKELAASSVIGDQGWLSYALKNVVELLNTEFPEIQRIHIDVVENPARNQVQFEFDFSAALKEHLDIFFYTGEKGRNLYQVCCRVVEINRGNLRYLDSRRVLLLTLPLNSRRLENDEVIFLIADNDYEKRLNTSELLTQNYSKVRKFEASTATELLKLATEVEPDCILFDPFFQDESVEEVTAILQELYLNPRLYKPRVILYTDYQKIAPVLKQIAETYEVSYIRKDISEIELKILMNQAISSVRSLKIMRDLAQTARRASEVDRLTSAYNRAYYEELIKYELIRAHENGTNLHLIVTDIDFFKSYNDLNGHLAGDQLLREFVSVLKDSVRSTDFIARYGGEEFVILLLNAPKIAAHSIAEKIRIAVADYNFAFQNKQPNGNLTASFGLAAYPEDGATPEALFHTADTRLYEAKRTGRNKVVSSSSPQTST